MIGWWIGNALGLVVLIPVIVVLANRVVSLALQANRYGADIVEHGIDIAGNLDPIPALSETAQEIREVKERALGYAAALERRL